MPEEGVLLDEDHTSVKQYQRVLLDAFHFMDRYPIPKLHPLYASFVAFLRDAIFINSESDLMKVRQYLIDRGMSADDVERAKSSYISKARIGRIIPQVTNNPLLSHFSRLILSHHELMLLFGGFMTLHLISFQTELFTLIQIVCNTCNWAACLIIQKSTSTQFTMNQVKPSFKN